MSIIDQALESKTATMQNFTIHAWGSVRPQRRCDANAKRTGTEEGLALDRFVGPEFC